MCQIILQTFSSDATFQAERRNSVQILETALLGLSQSTDSNRAATVFKALAVRGLQSGRLLLAKSAPTALESSDTRVGAFVLVVMRILSLLVVKSEHKNLERDLSGLAQRAIEVWNSAQTDEALDIKASLDLDPSLRTKWRSPTFDAEDWSAPGGIVSSTHPPIFTLFPTVMAKVQSQITENGVKIPGSFEETRSQPQVQEFCIHDGIGMAESSALVVRGKEEQEQREEDEKDRKVALVLEKAQQELEARKKIKSQRTGSISGLSSPTTSWNTMGGRRQSPED